MSALLSFLGGSAFRMVWGEASAWLTKRQDHKYELERMERQERADAAAHERNLRGITLQHDLGIKTIHVQHQAETEKGELDAWVEAVKATTRNTGIAWVDAWNQIIRPAGATMGLLMIAGEILVAGLVISDPNREVLYAFIGLFVADRSLAKRGK